MAQTFQDRRHAGEALAQALAPLFRSRDVIVLGLPRGGVPVAAVVARALEAPLDVMLVRKLGLPGHEELAMGAIASGGAVVMNPEVLAGSGVSEAAVARVREAEGRELARREQTYRGQRPPPAVAGRVVILVDDGIATGATMRAAVQALRQYRPARVVVAVPVAPPDTVASLRREADDVVCLATPEPFMGVGCWYHEFPQTTDREVCELLDEARATQRSPPPSSPRRGDPTWL